MALSSVKASETCKSSSHSERQKFVSPVKKTKNSDNQKIKSLTSQKTSSMEEARPIYLTGGTIVGKVTGDGTYIAGALSRDEQSELISDSLNKKVSLIGAVDPKGSQNLTEAHMAHVVKDLYDYMQKTKDSKKGVLITAGTDKISYLTHALRMLLPNPTVPIVLTAAMCPPNGHKQGLGNYEDGPVNIKNADLLLRHLEDNNINDIFAIMEDKAYGNHMEKARPAGVEEAFKCQFNTPLFQIQPQNQGNHFIKNAGDDKALQWVNQAYKKDNSLKKTSKGYVKALNKILTKMTSENGLRTFIITDAGQNNIDKQIEDSAKKFNVIGYRGTGNGNINEADSLHVIEKIIKEGGKTFVRGTQSNAGIVDNHHGEAGNVPIFGTQKLTDFMVPQGNLSTEKASRAVAILNSAGLNAPKKKKNEGKEEFLKRYKTYIANITDCLEAEQPLIKALDIVHSADKS